MISFVSWCIYIAGYLYYARYLIGTFAIDFHSDDNYCLRKPTTEFINDNSDRYYSSRGREKWHQQKLCGGSGSSWCMGVLAGLLVAFCWPIVMVIRWTIWTAKNLSPVARNAGLSFDKIFPKFKDIETLDERRERRVREAKESVEDLRGKVADAS